MTIEDFALLKQLGKGAFGKVFPLIIFCGKMVQVMLVKKKDTGELFALKSIKKLDLLEKGTLEYTRTEQMILEKVILFIKSIWVLAFKIAETSFLGQSGILFYN